MEDSSDQDPVLSQCPDCAQSVDVTKLGPYSKIECPHCGASVRVRTMMGKYNITGTLGAGGMSQVFRAVDLHLNREVALKILHQSLSQDSALTAMFEREAKLTASILHPNVVKVYTVGNDQGYFFIAMELVDATSLEELIANKGALSETDVLHVAHDVTSGLKAAYGEGLIHRDIKPGNMLVTPEGTSKLVDFGLAVHQGGEDELEDLWATPFYVPPEKLDGESDTYLGDIYSLGATLYHALAGKPPFEANTSSIEELKVVKQEEVDLKSVAPGVSKPTVKLVEQMMAYRAEDRPQDYDEILKLVEEVEAKQFGIHRSGRGETTDKRTTAIILGTFSALTAVAASIYIKVQQDKVDPTPGSLGISGDERVISAGDNTNTERFLEGRKLVSEGRFAKAAPIFDRLVVETSPSPSTRMWTLYLQGLVRLFQGEEIKSRQSFSLIQAIDPSGEAGVAAVSSFMAKAAPALGDTLPVMGAEDTFRKESLEMLGLLGAGLKNWQLGEFEYGLSLMESFASAPIPSGYEWIGPLKRTIEPFRRDYGRIATLPNPTRKESDKLASQKSELEKALAQLETRGSAFQFVQRRIDRIAAIEELVEKERKFTKAAIPDRPVMKSRPKSSGKGSKGGDDSLTAAEEADRETLAAMLDSLDEYGETLLFSGAVARLQGLSLETERGQRWQADLVSGFEQADRFVGVLAAQLDKGEYEGIVRRREGVPLEAKITAADTSRFVVDLGFGPNDVEVEKFATDWMVEAAIGSLPELSIENNEDWQKVAFFALATGQFEEAQRIARQVAELNPAFEAQWKRLMNLRSPSS